MKNKNSIFVFILVTIMFSLAKVYFIKDFSIPRENIVLSGKEMTISRNDLQLIETYLQPKNRHSPLWGIIGDFKANLQAIINPENANGYFEIATQNLPDLVLCLRKNLCGVISPEADRTPAHLLVARTLDVILISLKNKPELALLVDWNLVTEVSGLKGNEIRVSSRELLSKFDPRNGGKNHLFEIVESYKGKEKASFYSKLAEDISIAERPIFISTLNKSLERDDPETVISIVGSMKKFRLTSAEIASLGKALCRFKKGDVQQQNWKVIALEMKKYDINFEQNCP
jgi:hypothetical protein